MVDTSAPNSVSLITGAASGIGRHLAIHASNLGHDVVLIDLDANGLDETKKLCSKAETFCIDVGNYKQMVEVKEALDKKNINVNCISPGFIKTVMTEKIDEKFKETIISKIPSARLGVPDDIANAVGFLCSDQSSYINGETLHVNGGMYMA